MGNGRHQPQPGADPAPAAAYSSPQGWLPLTPNGVAAYAGATLKRVIVLQVISATVCTLVLAWLLAASIFPTIQVAIQNLPETGSISLGELQIADPTSRLHPLAAGSWLALDVDPTAGAVHNASRDLEIVLARTHVRLISPLGTTRIPYPPLWHAPLGRVDVLAAWEAWEAMLYGAILTTAWVGLLASWWVLATFHCLLPRIVAYFTDRELTLGGAWRLCAAALIPGALLMIAGLVALDLGAINGIQLALLFATHFLVPIVYSLLGTCHLPPTLVKIAKSKNPFGPPPPPTSVEDSSAPAPSQRKPANPFAAAE